MNNDLISRSALLDALKTEEWAAILGNSFVRYLKAKTLIEKIPAVDAETVFQQLGLMQEALDMAKSTLAPVVRCKDCKHFRDWGDGNITCHLWTDEWDAATVPDAFCSYGERRSDHAD